MRDYFNQGRDREEVVRYSEVVSKRRLKAKNKKIGMELVKNMIKELERNPKPT